MITESSQFRLLRDETREILRWQTHIYGEADTEFQAAQQIVRRLGAHYKNGRAEIGFWVPELVELEIPPERVMLDLFTAQEPIDFRQSEQQVTFQRDRIQLMREGNYMWGIIEGMVPGTRETLGTLYQLVYQARSGDWVAIRDHLAYSLPFGAFAPAEFYDMDALFEGRSDADHFQQLDTELDPDGVPRITHPTNILQVHAGYASDVGSLAGLKRIYDEIARKLEADEELHPAEKHYIAYDAIQLMPIEPTIEYEAGPRFWEAEDRPFADELKVTLRLPDMTNWGYDVVVSGSSATNPVLLESKRPDELLDLIATLHNFPTGPIGVIFDIVYGHLDNQALALMNKEFFAGANMYGQNVNFLQPVVRATLLEMMRRKHNYGVDGIRVDGAQDFKWWEPETNTMHHDDDFLQKMNDVELDVAGVHYRPWMIFEDGRPWPRDDWELASSYREVTKLMPNVWQWGPLTFAHNTPFLFTFWVSKWWRIREMADIGREWITGCSNHDTLRRGTQVPLDSRINTYLGTSLPEIIQSAYDNPASKLFDYAMMPGVPMEFLNASMRTPWGFIRNTDDRYGVKVVSEEALWTYWHMSQDSYSRPEVFPRLKELGFTDLEGLRRFLRTLEHAVKATDYYLDAIVRLMQNMYPPLAGPKLSVDNLKQIAKAFMDDVHDYCNVTLYWELQKPEHATFNLAAREFRHERRWLINNLTDKEALVYKHPTEGTVLFMGLRVSPDNDEHVLFLANMEGAPVTLIPNRVDVPNLRKTGWEVALATPGLEVSSADKELTLEDSQGVVFTRTRGGE